MPWLTTDFVLSQFSGRKKGAVELYRDFVLAGKGEGHRKEFYQGNVEGQILGEDHFAEEVLAKAYQDMPSSLSIEQILQVVCKQYEIHQGELCGGSRQRRTSEPRAVAALLVRKAEHLSLTDLSRRLKRDLSG